MDRVKISPTAYIWGALLVYLLPVKWLCSALVAALVHEISHIAALQMLGVGIRKIRITSMGAVIETGPVSNGKELICALAGPIGSFLLLLGYRFFPEVALCALIQGSFNLVPIYPLDGGRAVRSLIYMVSKEPERTVKWVERAILGLILFLMVTTLPRIVSGNILWLLILFGGACAVLRKIPCKPGKQELQ